MLMGAVPEMPVAATPAPADAKPPADAPLADPHVGSHAPPPTASIAMQPDTAAALSTTTPSVAPPAPINPERLPSDMPTVASAVAPAIEVPPIAPAAAPQPDWSSLAASTTDSSLALRSAQSSPDSFALAQLPQRQPSYVTWVLAVLTLGIYPLVTWLARRRKAKPGIGLD
jgi:hypothetical protein